MNIYYYAGLSQYEAYFSNEGASGGDFVLTAETAPSVPEPATWAMFLFGYGAIGIAIRRRRNSLALPQCCLSPAGGVDRDRQH